MTEHGNKAALSNQQRFDAILDAESVISATEATGGIPAAPQNQSELDAYATLLDTVVTPKPKTPKQSSPQ